MNAGWRRSRARRERGLFSLVEILLASIVLALSATATAYWIETVGNLSSDADEQTVGNGLVQVIAGFLANKAFREPGSEGSSLGPEPNEQVITAYDDVDDFAGLVCSPPLDDSLVPQSDLDTWSTRIDVTPVDADTLSPTNASDLRMVTVTALHKGRVVSQCWWLRARSPFE